jgi:predicted O-methyltransferase YrrM
VLEGLVLHLRPSSVLEFGAGRSSLVLAHALQAIGGGRLTSIEHQPQFSELSWRQMKRYGAVDAHLVRARLALQVSRHGLLHAYAGAGDALRARGPFGLVFIDGPPGAQGRDATLLSAAQFLAQGAIAVLDDAARPAEKTAVRRWERALDVERLYESDTIGRGLVVLKVAHPGSPSFSWRTFAGTIHDRLIELRRGASA